MKFENPPNSENTKTSHIRSHEEVLENSAEKNEDILEIKIREEIDPILDVLLAYQLRGGYDEFYSNSADRVSQTEDEDSKNYTLLDELVNRYGDNMKETIKAVQGAVAKNKDKQLFATDSSNEYEKVYVKLAETIIKDLEKVPRDKIKNETLQKKISKTIKNTFQKAEDINIRSEQFAALFSINDLDTFTEVWKQRLDQLFTVSDEYRIDTKRIEILQSNVYNILQNEIGKYEEIKEVDEEKNGEIKLSKQRLIKGYFAKNKETAHARMVGDICLAEDPTMLKNNRYFEYVLFDQEKRKCSGTSMLLEMPEADGKKYLLYCPNPSVSLISEVSAKKIYKMLTDRISTFAKENGFEAVLVNKTHGHSTNRAGLFQKNLEQSCLKDATGRKIVFNLKDSHVLGSSYKYQKGLNAVWIKI